MRRVARRAARRAARRVALPWPPARLIRGHLTVYGAGFAALGVSLLAGAGWCGCAPVARLVWGGLLLALGIVKLLVAWRAPGAAPAVLAAGSAMATLWAVTAARAWLAGTIPPLLVILWAWAAAAHLTAASQLGHAGLAYHRHWPSPHTSPDSDSGSGGV
jgi:hypothetical protein